MPTYTFRNKETGIDQTLSMKISELDDYKKNNPHLEQVLSSVPLADPTRLGIRKPDNGFREVLQKAKRSHHRSTINDW